MIRAATGDASSVQATRAEEDEIQVSRLRTATVKIPSGDPGWSRFVLTDFQTKAAERDLAKKADIYQPNSQTLKDAKEKVLRFAEQRGDAALILLPEWQVSLNKLKEGYTTRLTEMKPNHPEMQALDLAIKNHEAIEEMLLRSVRAGYAAKLRPVLLGATIWVKHPFSVHDGIERDSTADDVTADGIVSGKHTRGFNREPKWYRGRGLCFSRQWGGRTADGRNVFRYYYLDKAGWSGDSAEVRAVIGTIRALRDPAKYRAADLKPQKNKVPTGLLEELRGLLAKEYWSPAEVENVNLLIAKARNYDIGNTPLQEELVRIERAARAHPVLKQGRWIVSRREIEDTRSGLVWCAYSFPVRPFDAHKDLHKGYRLPTATELSDFLRNYKGNIPMRSKRGVGKTNDYYFSSDRDGDAYVYVWRRGDVLRTKAGTPRLLQVRRKQRVVSGED